MGLFEIYPDQVFFSDVQSKKKLTKEMLQGPRSEGQILASLTDNSVYINCDACNGRAFIFQDAELSEYGKRYESQKLGVVHRVKMNEFFFFSKVSEPKNLYAYCKNIGMLIVDNGSITSIYVDVKDIDVGTSKVLKPRNRIERLKKKLHFKHGVIHA